MTRRVLESTRGQSSGPTLLSVGRLPGMKPNAPRRNLLVGLAYVLVVGSLYWLASAMGALLGLAFEAISRIEFGARWTTRAARAHLLR